MVELTYTRLPPVLPAFGRVAMSRGASDKTLPEPLIARASGVSAKGGALRAYAAVCGGQADGVLPICYPQVMVWPLQLTLLGLAEFPLAAVGLVHLANRIEQHRPLAPDEAFDVEVAIRQIDETERGYEFDIVTRYTDQAGELVWEAVARLLSRKQSGGGKKSPPPAAEPSAWPLLEEWALAGNLGRRYARASGDFNPIHLSALSARLLGFKRAIIHGMWSLARSAAALPDGTATAGVLDAQFKTPMFLPGRASLHGQADSAGFAFEVRDVRSHKPILAGHWAPS